MIKDKILIVDRHLASEPRVSGDSTRTASPVPSSQCTAVGSTAIAIPRTLPPPSQKARAPAHIIVTFAGRSDKTAWGKIGLARIGYHNFAKSLFHAYILHPSRAPPRKFSPFKPSKRSRFRETYRFLRDDFVARANLVPQFVGSPQSSGSDSSVPPEGNEGNEAITLQPVGWAEMIHELVGITVRYNIPDQYPWKEECFGSIEQKAKLAKRSEGQK
ncbi:hypothetical protein C8Q73DRAFT_698059 [Cubamyces lactineus]|nr:hypothetical protein C8Q73DRAFT_698059 [Cubamyces lactineus]